MQTVAPAPELLPHPPRDKIEETVKIARHFTVHQVTRFRCKVHDHLPPTQLADAARKHFDYRLSVLRRVHDDTP